jgi:cytoskeletal protein RodZ
MKIMNVAHILLVTALLPVAISFSALPHPARQVGDQNQSDPGTAEKDKKSEKAHANASASQSAPDSASKKGASKESNGSDKGAATASTNGPASKAAATRQQPPTNGAGMVWVNTDSGIYHKPGTHWYGKTKKGKYMTEADAIKAGYHAAKKE